ncbi:MAG: cobalt ECF transporter T component CbiQ [Geitlerinemataceae cyanobacterium]
MTNGLDRYAKLDSPIHNWEVRCKLVGLMSLVFAFSCVRDGWLLGAIAVVAAILYGLSELPRSFWLSRLRYPGYFLGFVVLILPFTTGETQLLDLGVLALRQEGILAAASIVVRFLAILTVTLVLFATHPIVETLAGMRALGLPAFLTDTMLLFYRYLSDTVAQFRTMQTAMRLRGFQRRKFNWRDIKVMALLSGTLLVRSYEQSEQIYRAMRLRGYGQQSGHKRLPPSHNGDRLALGASVLLAIAIVVTEFVLA